MVDYSSLVNRRNFIDRNFRGLKRIRLNETETRFLDTYINLLSSFEQNVDDYNKNLIRLNLIMFLSVSETSSFPYDREFVRAVLDTVTNFILNCNNDSSLRSFVIESVRGVYIVRDGNKALLPSLYGYFGGSFEYRHSRFRLEYEHSFENMLIRSRGCMIPLLNLLENHIGNQREYYSNDTTYNLICNYYKD